MHWYTQDGQPCYEVTGKSGKLRATTLADARKLHLVPSVTTVTSILAKPFLEQWKIRKALEQAYSLNKGSRSLKQWSAIIMSKLNKESQDIMDRGTDIHNKLEKYYTDLTVDVNEKEVTAAVNILHGIDNPSCWIPEESFTCKEHGFGGKVDLHCKGSGMVLDFKTKGFSEVPVKAYPEHLMQIAAYIRGLGIPGAKGFNLFISTEVPGLVYLHEWTAKELQWGWEMFKACLTIWKMVNNYYPECRTTNQMAVADRVMKEDKNILSALTRGEIKDEH